jgi:transcriptional antiterminator RfaH
MARVETSGTSPKDLGVAWFCVRSQPKHEHIAAANLRQHESIEVFNPLIRFKRPTRRGPVWVTEALFPSYLFARFDWRECLRLVHHTYGVAGIVHFGTRWPTIPEPVIQELQSVLGTEQVKTLGESIGPGDEVRVAGGVFHGLQGVVTRLMPARERVAVLLDFLGRQTAVELPFNSIVKQERVL